MSENIKNLTVGLTLNTNNFSTQMSAVNAKIQGLQQNYKKASADSKNFDNSFVGLSSKVQSLQGLVTTYGEKLNLVSDRLEEAKNHNKQLEEAMNSSRDTFNANKSALDALAKEGKEGTEEFQRLQKTVTENEKTFNNLDKAYTQSSTNVQKLTNQKAKLEQRLSSLQSELTQSSSKLKELGTFTESSAQKLDRLDAELSASSSRFALLRAKIGENASASKQLAITKQELIEKERILSDRTNVYQGVLDKTKVKLQQHKTTLESVQLSITETNTKLQEAVTRYGANSKEVQELQQKLYGLRDAENFHRASI